MTGRSRRTTGKVSLLLLLSLITTILFCISFTSPVYAETGSVVALALDQRATIISSDIQSIRIDFELTGLEKISVIKDGEDFESYSLSGEGVTLDYGRPVLPFVSRFIVVPPDRHVELVYSADEPRRIPAGDAPAICDDDDYRMTFNTDDNQIYPPVYAEMSEPTVMRGVRMVKVTTYPIQYDASDNSYLHREHIVTELRFTDDEAVNPAYVPVRRNRSANFLRVISALAINGDQVGRDDPDRGQEPPYVGHYCIASHEGNVEYMAPFIEWRRKSGYKVDVLSIPSNTANNPSSTHRIINERYDDYLDEGIDPFEYVFLIGDRSQYSYSTGPQNILQVPTGVSVWPNAPHSDYEMGLLEGNDAHPDVGISRFINGGRSLVELAVGRTLGYEATPYMEETEWFTMGGVYSQHWGNSPTSAWHISIHTNVRWGIEVLEHLGFDDVDFYEYYEHDQQGQRIGPVIRDWFNEGMNVMMGRAENYYWRQGFSGVNRNVIFPVNLCYSGHGEWCAESMYRTGSGNDLKGPVVTSCGWGGPATSSMSIMWLGLVNGVMQRDFPIGWGYTYAAIAFESFMPNFQFRNMNTYLQTKTDTDIYGDPGLQPWIGVPTIVEAEFPETITPDTRMIQVHVTNVENDEDMEGAQVTLYSPMNMPDFDEDEYADYDDMVMITRKSDANGIVRFVFDEPVFDYRYELFLTITGRSICPLFHEIEVERNHTAIDIAEYSINDEEGDEIDEINPGATVLLVLSAVNLGEEIAEDVTAVVSPSLWVDVEENEISYGDIDAGEEVTSDETVTLIVSSVCPDGESRPATRPDLIVQFFSGDESWFSAIRLDVSAPCFDIHDIIGGEVIPDTVHELNLDIVNIGRMAARGVSARLVTMGMGISVINNNARFPDIESGDHRQVNGNPFIVSGNRLVPPGFRNEMMLIVSCNDEFIDTTYFELQMDEPRENAPSPPDNYGYMCFDNSDEEWEISPEYDWIEISTRDNNRQFDGTRIDFSGNSPYDIGEAEVIDLGFTTRFYGYDYDQITVCTNGFISMGDQELTTNYQNWPLDRAIGGGVGMIAPFWDDLHLSGDDAGIYYYYDEDDARMIIEWYKLRHRNGGNTDLTFQVIILDADIWIIEETGNPFILFQYQSIASLRNVRQGDPVWEKDIPYASVGISSPDGNTGISYFWNDEYPEWAAELTEGRAMLFTTTPRFKSGFLEGTVTDAATGRPIENAVIFTKHGFTARTDEEGYWFIIDALAEIEFDITASKVGYNDSTYKDLLLEEDGEMTIDFALLHPEFLPSTQHLHTEIDPEITVNLPYSILNNGNGSLKWSLSRMLPGGAERDPWERRLTYDAGVTVEDIRLEGV
ncbi:carboxypeptidase regulatory-like domain-containing protein, partial [bacterium]|nr:carboxypeptidase regulatory-like domain-containing protein [bacterium]